MVWRLQCLIPPRLCRITDYLCEYCRERSKTIDDFYDKLKRKFAVRLFNWIAMSLGQNKVDECQAQLDDCEDWLNIARLTIRL